MTKSVLYIRLNKSKHGVVTAEATWDYGIFVSYPLDRLPTHIYLQLLEELSGSECPNYTDTMTVDV